MPTRNVLTLSAMALKRGHDIALKTVSNLFAVTTAREFHRSLLILFLVD
jgi:hypothetical protein